MPITSAISTLGTTLAIQAPKRRKRRAAMRVLEWFLVIAGLFGE
jgi:hypothetical protein